MFYHAVDYYYLCRTWDQTLEGLGFLNLLKEGEIFELDTYE